MTGIVDCGKVCLRNKMESKFLPILPQVQYGRVYWTLLEPFSRQFPRLQIRKSNIILRAPCEAFAWVRLLPICEVFAGFRALPSREPSAGVSCVSGAVSPPPGFAWVASRKHRPSARPPRLQGLRNITVSSAWRPASAPCQGFASLTVKNGAPASAFSPV